MYFVVAVILLKTEHGITAHILLVVERNILLLEDTFILPDILVKFVYSIEYCLRQKSAHYIPIMEPLLLFQLQASQDPLVTKAH